MEIWIRNLTTLVYTASLLLFNNVGAALIETDDSIFGIKSLTLDTSTNLAWLDLSITEGVSFNDISKELIPGGEYQGFRFASPDEVRSLFNQAQIPDINDPGYFSHYGTPENAAPALSLIELMGPSYQIQINGALLSQIAGFSSQRITSFGFDLIQMPYATVRERVTYQNGIRSYAEVFTTGSAIFPSSSYVGVGSWLVKPALVSEPPVLVLIISGVFGLFYMSHRKIIHVKPNTNNKNNHV